MLESNTDLDLRNHKYFKNSMLGINLKKKKKLQDLCLESYKIVIRAMLKK